MNVHIADDFKLIIDGFRAILDQYDIAISGTSRDGIELIKWLENNTTDIVILDISMPKMDGIEVIEYLKRTKSKQKVIVVSAYLHLEFIRSTVGNGAKGYISKFCVDSCIVDALHAVYNGGTFFSTDVQEILIKECLNFEDNPDSEFATSMLEKSLSPQELKILILHAKKYTSKEISEELNISLSTIRSYRARIRDKLRIPKKARLLYNDIFLKGKII